MHHVAMLAAAPEVPLPPGADKMAGNAMWLFAALLALSLALLTVAVLLLRVRWRRSHLKRALGVGDPPARGPVRQVDPWSESARRLEIDEDDESDTVDFDPSDLGPDDIEPPPSNGKGHP